MKRPNRHQIANMRAVVFDFVRDADIEQYCHQDVLEAQRIEFVTEDFLCEWCGVENETVEGVATDGFSIGGHQLYQDGKRYGGDFLFSILRDAVRPFVREALRHRA